MSRGQCSGRTPSGVCNRAGRSPRGRLSRRGFFAAPWGAVRSTWELRSARLRRGVGGGCFQMDKDWTKGDSVIHADKPEWGSGEVLIAEQGIHEGKPCQRLTIRFTRAGMKTLSTAFANLKSAADSPRL